MASSPSVLFTRLTSRARLKHLQLLVHIGELESLQRAATAIGMSQPAATYALAELEALVGTRLFERHSRGMRPTVAGHAVLPHLRSALRAMQDGAEAVSASQQGAQQAIRMAAIGAGISGLLQRVLPGFSARHPTCVFEVLQFEADDLLAAWDARALDLIVCRAPAQLPEGASFVPIADDRYCVVGRASHPLAGRQGVPLAELHRWTWLMQPPRSIASRDFQALWAGFDTSPPQRWVNSRSLLLMLAMLQQQELLAFIPYLAARQLLENALLVEIDCELHQALPPLGVIVRTAKAEADPALAALVQAFVETGGTEGPASVPSPRAARRRSAPARRG